MSQTIDEQVEALREAFEKCILVGTDRPMRSKKGEYLSSYIVERWRGFQDGAAYQATLSPDLSGVIAKIEAIVKDISTSPAITPSFSHLLGGRLLAHECDLKLLRSLPSSQRLARLERFAEAVRVAWYERYSEDTIDGVSIALAELDKEGEK